jgi:hypothetical protein
MSSPVPPPPGMPSGDGAVAFLPGTLGAVYDHDRAVMVIQTADGPVIAAAGAAAGQVPAPDARYLVSLVSCRAIAAGRPAYDPVAGTLAIPVPGVVRDGTVTLDARHAVPLGPGADPLGRLAAALSARVAGVRPGGHPLDARVTAIDRALSGAGLAARAAGRRTARLALMGIAARTSRDLPEAEEILLTRTAAGTLEPSGFWNRAGTRIGYPIDDWPFMEAPGLYQRVIRLTAELRPYCASLTGDNDAGWLPYATDIAAAGEAPGAGYWVSVPVAMNLTGAPAGRVPAAGRPSPAPGRAQRPVRKAGPR